MTFQNTFSTKILYSTFFKARTSWSVYLLSYNQSPQYSAAQTMTIYFFLWFCCYTRQFLSFFWYQLGQKVSGSLNMDQLIKLDVSVSCWLGAQLRQVEASVLWHVSPFVWLLGFSQTEICKFQDGAFQDAEVDPVVLLKNPALKVTCYHLHNMPC